MENNNLEGFDIEQTGNSVINGNSEKSKGNLGPDCFCPVCNKIIPKQSLKDHLLMHEAPKYQCDICSRWYPKVSDLNYHLRFHTGETSYKCSYCGEYFRRLSNKIKHERSHTKEKPLKYGGETNFRCGCCGRGYTTPGGLVRHMRYHERQKKRFECKMCDSRFYNSVDLLNHKQQHENPRTEGPSGTLDGESKNNYTSDLCDKRFPHRQDIQDYSWTHVETNEIHYEESPFICAHCGDAHKTCDSLELHLMTHVLTNGDVKEHDDVHDIKKKGNEIISSFVYTNDLQEEASTYEQSQICEQSQIPELGDQSQICEMGDLKCNVCEVEFKVLHELKLHILSHYDETKYFTCQSCGEILLDHTCIEEHLLEH